MADLSRRARSLLSFQAFQALNLRRCREVFFHEKDWTPNDWALAVAGEVGELCNLLKKIKRGDFLLGDQRQNVLRECADVFCYLDLLMSSLEADTGIEVLKKFDEVSDRYGYKRDAILELGLQEAIEHGEKIGVESMQPQRDREGAKLNRRDRACYDLGFEAGKVGLQEALKEKDAEIVGLESALQGTRDAFQRQWGPLSTERDALLIRAEQAEAALTEKDEALRAMTDSAERAYDAKCRAQAEIEELKGRIVALMGL